MKYVHIELKVCEGCGMLWLRPKQANQNFCSGCVQRLSSFPSPVGKRGGGRPRTRRPRPSTAISRNRGCAHASGQRASVAGEVSAAAPRNAQAGAR